MSEALIWLIAASAIVAGLTEALRRLPAWVGLLVFVAVPLGSTPIWIVQGATAFVYVKVYSVCLAAIYIHAMRRGEALERPGWRWAGFALLWLNIAEAAVTAQYNGQPAVAAAGALLLFTQATPHLIRLDASSGHREVHYALGTGWVIAYSVWNFAFVYPYQDGLTSAFGLVHVGVPLLLSLGCPERWVQARTVALALCMIVLTWAPAPPFVADGRPLYDPAIGDGLELAALVVGVLVVVQQLAGWGPATGSLMSRLGHRLGLGRHRAGG